jgi:hypothetical protein
MDDCTLGGREIIKVPEIKDLIGTKITKLEIHGDIIKVYLDNNTLIRVVPVLEKCSRSLIACLDASVGTY